MFYSGIHDSFHPTGLYSSEYFCVAIVLSCTGVAVSYVVNFGFIVSDNIFFWYNYFDGDLVLQYKVIVIEAWLISFPVFQCPFYFKAGFATQQAPKQLGGNFSSGLTLWLPGNSRGRHLLHQLSPCATYDDKRFVTEIVYYLYYVFIYKMFEILFSVFLPLQKCRDIKYKTQCTPSYLWSA
jgi:hypothetical protein